MPASLTLGRCRPFSEKIFPQGFQKTPWKNYSINWKREWERTPRLSLIWPEERYDPTSTLTPEERVKLLAQERRERNNPKYELPVPTLEKIRDNFLENDHIQKYLALPADENAPIEPEQYQLYCIMQNLLKADSAVPPGELLSPQEVMLLQYSKYITECLAGIKQGLRNTYRVVPGVREIRVRRRLHEGDRNFHPSIFQGQNNRSNRRREVHPSAIE